VTLVGLIFVDLVLIVLLDVVVVRPLARRLRRRLGDRRIGLLPVASEPSPEQRRADRLRQIGEAGTYRVHNCGRILHVDYDRGELIVERDARNHR